MTPESVAAASGPRPRPVDNRIYALDLLRFAAALMVLGFHLMAAAAKIFEVDPVVFFSRPLWEASRYGTFGVQLFFLISGFVICMSSWGRSGTDFFISRVTRLMPAYLFAVLVTTLVLVIWVSPWRGRPDLVQVLANLTLLQGMFGILDIDVVYWTLLIELKFYLLFAAVAWLGVTYQRAVYFCVGWTTASLFAQFVGSKTLSAVFEPGYTSYFVAGITLYLIYRFGANLLLWGILVASWIFSVIGVTRQVTVVNSNKPEFYLDYLHAIALVTLFFVVMLGVALHWFTWIRWRFLATVGALTYPIYLLHTETGQTVMRELREVLPPRLLFLVAVATVLLLGYLVHRFVERPAARVVRRELRSSFEQMRMRR